jgi:hypothetical protein
VERKNETEEAASSAPAVESPVAPNVTENPSSTTTAPNPTPTPTQSSLRHKIPDLDGKVKKEIINLKKFDEIPKFNASVSEDKDIKENDNQTQAPTTGPRVIHESTDHNGLKKQIISLDKHQFEQPKVPEPFTLNITIEDKKENE